MKLPLPGCAPNRSRARTRAGWQPMQRADRNIDDLLENLNGTFHRLRQSGIDEALFGVRVEPPTLRTRTS